MIQSSKLDSSMSDMMVGYPLFSIQYTIIMS